MSIVPEVKGETNKIGGNSKTVKVKRGQRNCLVAK